MAITRKVTFLSRRPRMLRAPITPTISGPIIGMHRLRAFEHFRWHGSDFKTRMRFRRKLIKMKTTEAKKMLVDLVIFEDLRGVVVASEIISSKNHPREIGNDE